MSITAAAGAVGASVVNRLIGSGVQRLGSLVFQKVVRIARIDNALKGAATKNFAVQTAVQDFEIVIGTRYGQLNRELDDFLREIERSGLINTMVEHALVDRDPKEVKRIFCDLHKKVMGQNTGAPEVLFDKMMKSFSITLEEICKDKILLEAFRFCRSDLDARLDRVDLALVELAKTSKRKATSLQDLQPTLLKIAKGLQAINRSIRIETTKGPRSVDITRIYIPSKLKYRDTKKNAEKTSAIARIIGKGSHKSHRTDPLDVRQDVAQEQLAIVTYNDLRLLFSRVVVLGDPGGGKSTLCQHVCYDLARQAVASLQTQSTQITAQLQKFPIKIVLRVYEKARTLEPQLTIHEFILRELQNHVTAEEEEIDEALRYLLATGSAVLAFDGLDEILATPQRRDFVDLVNSFCNQFPLCPVIVTSRLVGYDDAPLPSEFDELVLEKFDDTEVLSYVRKFMKVVGGHDEKESQKRASAFFEQTTNNAADLRRNPLMLGLMAWLFNMREGDVPSNRPEIYAECAVLMFEKWDPERNIKANIPEDFDLLELFSRIASKIFGNPELRAGVEVSWLEKEVRAFFQEVYENKARAFEAAKALVTFMTVRAWVMSAVGDKVFAFTHQTFLEYFFARHIDDMRDSIKEILDIIMPRVLQHEWDIVSHLSLQIKSHRNLRRQNEALDQLRAMMFGSLESKQRAALISFVARSLEYLAGAESHIKPVVSAVVDYAIDCAMDANNSAWKDVSQCAQSCVERRQYVRSVIVGRLVDEFRREDIARSSVIKDAVSHLLDQQLLTLQEYQGLPAELANSVRELLKPYISERIQHNAFFAATAWCWYGMLDRSLVAKHGVVPYFNTKFADYDKFDGLSIIAVRASHRLNIEMPEEISRQKARDAMVWFGSVGFSTWPFQKHLFRAKHGEGLELWVWDNLFREENVSPELAAGYLFAMMVATELQNRLHGEARGFGRSSERKPTFNRKEIIDWAVAKKGMDKLRIFPRIKAAVEATSLFI